MTDNQNKNSWADLFFPQILRPPPMGYSLEQLRGDVFGGLTAAVVALPLALAFGVASGAGPIAGLYGAIATGFFASVFGGTSAQVSGPTGPMTVVMGAIIATHATNLPEAFAIVILGGLMQIVFGMLRVGSYIAYTPYSVVSGFMTGIGVIIMMIEVLPFFGFPTAPGGVIGALQALSSLPLSEINPAVVILSIVSLGTIVFWPSRLQRMLPAPLAILILGTAFSMWFVPGAPVIGEVPSGLPGFALPAVEIGVLPQLLQAAFVLALLGSIDSLLTSLVADSVTRTRHDSDKELIGQGLGNVVAGLIGALPGAGATMRTLVNIRAGGRTPLAGALHALILLALALGLGPVVAHVPHAVLAAILMKVGWDIIDWGYLKRMRRAPREKFFVMLVTLALTVFVDLITAVAVGIILASFVSARHMAHDELKGLRQSADGETLEQLSDEERKMLRDAQGKVLVTLLDGTFSYASARELARQGAAALPDYHYVVYDFAKIGYVDTSAALAIEEMFALSRANEQTVLISGLGGDVLKTLDGLDVLRHVPASCRFANRYDAIVVATDAVKSVNG